MKNTLRWDNLTWPEIKKAAGDQAIILIPVGSIEQHGPHLPVGCDYILAENMCNLIAAEMDKRGTKALVAPTIKMANSTHHMSFPGTITLSPNTFNNVMIDYCLCVNTHGFNKIVFVNGHGGNNAPLSVAQVDIHRELGLRVYSMGYWSGGGDIQEKVLEGQKGMIHACEGETSIMLAIDETLVDPCYKETSGNSDYPTAAERAHRISAFRPMEDMTENGVMGSSFLATKEKGQRIVAAMVTGAADILCASDLW